MDMGIVNAAQVRQRGWGHTLHSSQSGQTDRIKLVLANISLRCLAEHIWLISPPVCALSTPLQVKADVYEKIDKELLQYVEDVLLNRREDSTERLLEYAGTLDPKSKPTAVRKLNEEPPAPVYTPKQNPIPADFDPLAPDADLPPVPTYKQWRDPLATSEAFGQLEALMKERIIFIDGAMGTMIQRYKLEEEDFRGDRCAGAAQGRSSHSCRWPQQQRQRQQRLQQLQWVILPSNWLGVSSCQCTEQ
jgi:hypothetical protein